MEAVRIRLLESFPFPDREPLDVLAPAHEGDAGIDLYAAEDAVLLPGERRLVATGLAIALPAGMEAQVRPRSGNALRHGLGLLNSPGTIDPGYRGPVKVLCYNANPVFGPEELAAWQGRAERSPGAGSIPGAEEESPRGAAAMDALRSVVEGLAAALRARAVHIRRGERIAQLVFARFERPPLQVVETLDDTARGAGGFGSTGTVSGLASPGG